MACLCRLTPHLVGCRRPFAWRGDLYLAHWIYFAPGEERYAISALDEAAGVVRLVHVLSPLSPAVAAAQLPRGLRARVKAESLSSVGRATFTREKNWGLVEDRGELLVFHVMLPCTVVLAFDLSDGNATAVNDTARVASRACFADAAEAIAKATGACLDLCVRDRLAHPTLGLCYCHARWC